MSRIDDLDAFILEAKRLRASAVEANAEFFHHMMIGEEDELLWRGDPKQRTGYTTFAELITSTNVCTVAQYVAFKEAVTRFGWEAVHTIGFDVTRLLLRIPAGTLSRIHADRAAELAVLEDLKDFRAKNHTTPSVRHACTIIRKHYTPTPMPRAPRTPDKEMIETLTRKNNALLRENERLRKALAKAEATILRLKSTLKATL